MSDNDPEVIMTFSDRVAAETAASRLQSEGIEAHVWGGDASGAIPVVTATFALELAVPSLRAAEAMEILMRAGCCSQPDIVAAGEPMTAAKAQRWRRIRRRGRFSYIVGTGVFGWGMIVGLAVVVLRLLPDGGPVPAWRLAAESGTMIAFCMAAGAVYANVMWHLRESAFLGGGENGVAGGFGERRDGTSHEREAVSERE